MVIKRLFILLLFIPQFAFSEYYVKDNNIYNDGNKVKTILINDELGSVLLDNKDVIGLVASCGKLCVSLLTIFMEICFSIVY